MLKSVERERKSDISNDPLRAIAGSGGGAVLWARQGAACAERGDSIGALQCFQRSIQTDLDCVEAWAGLSEVFNGMRDRARADACLEVAVRIHSRCLRLETA